MCQNMLRRRLLSQFIIVACGITLLLPIAISGQALESYAVLDLEGRGISALEAATLTDRMRSERFQAAEKRGAEAATKILFPLILFIMPATFIIILGPIVLRFIYGLA